MEKLIGIEEFYGEKIEGSEYDWNTFDGFKIKTDQRELVIAISDGYSVEEVLIIK